MKRGRKIIRSLLVLMVVFMFGGNTVVADNSLKSREAEMKARYGEDIIADRLPDINNDPHNEYLIPMDVYFSDEWQANLAFNRILESFGQHAMRITEEIDFTKYPDRPDYGDSFAGAYLGEDGHLVVLIAHEEGTKEYEDAAASLTKAASPTDIGFIPKLNFKPAKYSFSYLLSVMEDLIDRTEQKRSESKSDDLTPWDRVSKIEVSFGRNQVNLTVEEDNMKNKISDMNSLTEELDYLGDAVKIEVIQKTENKADEEGQDAQSIFDQTNPSPLSAFTLKPGAQIRASLSSYGSMGYRAKRVTSTGTEYGFVTAGHLLTYQGQIAYSGDMIDIGITRLRQNSGSIDAAFVRMDNPNYTVSNQTVNGVNLATSYTLPTVGMQVAAASHQHQVPTGVVHDVSYEWVGDNGQKMNGMIQVILDIGNFPAIVPGDSGSVVYRNNGNFYIIGIIKATDYEYVAVVPASVINQQWGVIPY